MFYPINRVLREITAGILLALAIAIEPKDIDVNTNITRRRAIGLMAAAPALLSGRSSAGTGAVDETGFARIGGIDQWIGIQGSDLRNPVMTSPSLEGCGAAHSSSLATPAFFRSDVCSGQTPPQIGRRHVIQTSKGGSDLFDLFGRHGGLFEVHFPLANDGPDPTDYFGRAL